MKKNFSIRAFTEVVLDGVWIDLHNLYRPASIGTDLGGDRLRVSFERDPQSKRPQTLPSTVTFICTGNLGITFNNLVGLPVAIPEDAVEVAYYDADCDWDQFLDEELLPTRALQDSSLCLRADLSFVCAVMTYRSQPPDRVCSRAVLICSSPA